jgi:hypothetical protein
MQLLCGDTVFLGFVVSPVGCFLLWKISLDVLGVFSVLIIKHAVG